MKTSYINRYGDNIIFEQVDDSTVHMSGFNMEWMRAAYNNDYSEAYEMYKNYCFTLEDPDYTYLVEDVNENKIRIMHYPEFVDAMDHAIHDKNHSFNKLWAFVTTDYSSIYMIDPAGGPYITVGTNLGLYFNDKKPRIIENISIKENKVIFNIK